MDHVQSVAVSLIAMRADFSSLLVLAVQTGLRVSEITALALVSVSISATGFVRSGRPVRAEKRAKSTVKGSGGEITPAG